MDTGLADPDDEGDDRRAWARAGVPADAVEEWRRFSFAPESAGAWHREGVVVPLEAAQWETAGVTPSTVGLWVVEGLSAMEAAQWREFGFDLDAVKVELAAGRGPGEAFRARQGPGIVGHASISTSIRSGGPWVDSGTSDPSHPMSAVRRFLESGVDHEVLHEYVRRQWVDDAALEWARWGIRPFDADAWHEIGLRPGEAGPLAAEGRTPVEVLRAWWGTGIAFDEIAPWIGAGFDPQEAVALIADGGSVEAAIARRAERVEPDPEAFMRRPPALWDRRGGPGREVEGDPPKDEQAARARITEVYAGMLDTYDEQGGLALVDGGSNLGPSIAVAQQRVSGADGATTTVTVTGIRFVNEKLARVAYSLSVRGGINVDLRDQIGEALLIDGRWLAGRDTVTDLLRRAGAECPPRPEPRTEQDST